jgi:hypothetical protein
VLPVKFGRLLLKLEAGLVAGARNRQKISAGNSTETGALFSWPKLGVDELL